MHGRVKKDVVELSPEEKEKQTQHVNTARALFGKLLQQRRSRIYSQQTLDLTSKALQFHPEFPTLWGYRREILQSLRADGDQKQLFEGEMKLLEKALGKAHKVYSIWFHRKWAVEQMFAVCGANVDEAQRVLNTELELCGRLLKVDERNFHCWNHRSHVMGLMRRSLSSGQAPTADPPGGCAVLPSNTDSGDVAASETGAFPFAPADRPASDVTATQAANAEGPRAATSPLPDLVELDVKLSKDLIDRNFSNYSAWHLRALLQQQAPGEPAQGSGIDVPTELEWVQQGIYTEPNDQSVWLYHHWLTILSRGSVQARVTHCSVLSEDLYVFFSKPVCIDGSIRVIVKGRVSDEQIVVNGCLRPLGPDPNDALHRLTRQLSAARKRWVLGCRFIPEGTGSQQLARLLSGADLEIDVPIEVIGTRADCLAASSCEHLEFSGRPSLCDVDTLQQQDAATVSPALLGLLSPHHDSERAEALKVELERVDELLEIEPDCRWALLARGRLAMASATTPADVSSAEKDVVKGYERMSELDPLRSGFYSEARAACLLRIRALEWLMAQRIAAPLDISGLALRHISPTTMLSTFGVRVLDLSGNALQALGPVLLLTSLQELRAAQNQLTGDVAEVFCLQRLRRLDVSTNRMELRGKASDLPETLVEIDLSRNQAILGLASGDTSGDQAAILGKLIAGSSSATVSSWAVELNLQEGKCRCHCNSNGSESLSK